MTNQFTFHKTFIFINNAARTSNYIACLVENMANLRGGRNIFTTKLQTDSNLQGFDDCV